MNKKIQIPGADKNKLPAKALKKPVSKAKTKA